MRAMLLLPTLCKDKHHGKVRHGINMHGNSTHHFPLACIAGTWLRPALGTHITAAITTTAGQTCDQNHATTCERADMQASKQCMAGKLGSFWQHAHARMSIIRAAKRRQMWVTLLLMMLPFCNTFFTPTACEL